MHTYNLLSSEQSRLMLFTNKSIACDHIANPEEIAGYINGCMIKCIDLTDNTEYIATLSLIRTYLENKIELLLLSRLRPNTILVTVEEDSLLVNHREMLAINTIGVINAYYRHEDAQLEEIVQILDGTSKK